MWSAGRPLLLVSTNSWAWDTLVNQCMNIATMSQPELTQSVADRPRGWAGHPTLEPFDLWFGPMWSTCHKHFCSDTIFGGIPNVLVIS
jgi:hypothetical protein